jgi:MoaA/NifB/PqqE/SkfB family radical SAM enzyme
MSTLRQQQLLNMHSDYFNGQEIIPLDFIDINVTRGCFFKCKTCHEWKDNDYHLTLDSCERFLLAISPYVKKSDVTFVYGGGEPLMNKDILRLVGLASRFGYLPSIITNGWLVTKTMAENLMQSGLRVIMLSLDSSDEAVHDEIRGMKGSYRRIMSAIDYLLESRKKSLKEFSIGINTTINALNLDTIVQLASWVNSNKDKISHIRFQAVTQVLSTELIQNWHKDERYSFLWPKDAGKINKAYDELISMKKKGFNIENSVRHLEFQKEYFLHPGEQSKSSVCGFYKSIFVKSDGDIFMCLYDSPIGNANDKTLTNETFKRFIPKEQRKILDCNIINCHFDMNCNFN